MNIKLNDINSKLINNDLTFEGKIIEVKEIKPKLIFSVLECNSCMYKYHIKHDTDYTAKPIRCDSCGANSFKLLEEKSEYIDSQLILVEDTEDFVDKYCRKRSPNTIRCMVFDEDVNQHIEGDTVLITGKLLIEKNNIAYIKVGKITLIAEKED